MHMKALVTGFHMPYRLSPDLKYPWSGENTGPIENTGPKISTPSHVTVDRPRPEPCVMSRQSASALACEDGRLDVRVAVRVWARKGNRPALQAMPADGCIRLLGSGDREATVLRFGSVLGPDASQVRCDAHGGVRC